MDHQSLNALYYNGLVYSLNVSGVNVYLSSGYQNKLQIQCIASYLRSFPKVNLVGDWYAVPSRGTGERYLQDIQNGVLQSNIVLCFYPYGKTGSLQEMAFAVAKCIPCIYIVPEEFRNDDPLLVSNFIFVDVESCDTAHQIKSVMLRSLKEKLNEFNANKMDYHGGFVVHSPKILKIFEGDDER